MISQPADRRQSLLWKMAFFPRKKRIKGMGNRAIIGLSRSSQGHLGTLTSTNGAYRTVPYCQHVQRLQQDHHEVSPPTHDINTADPLPSVIREINRINERELELGGDGTKASWHDDYKGVSRLLDAKQVWLNNTR